METLNFDQPGGKGEPSLGSKPKGQWLSLEFFTEVEVLQAQLYCHPGARILDVLNQNSDENSRSRHAFMGLLEQGTEAKSAPELSEHVFIRKEMVQFVAAAGNDTGRGLGADPGSRRYPLVDKTPVKLSVRLRSYTLTGYSFLVKDQTLKFTLDESAIFLPLTDVSISSGSQAIGQKPFVAVNKRQIISIKEVPSR